MASFIVLLESSITMQKPWLNNAISIVNLISDSWPRLGPWALSFLMAPCFFNSIESWWQMKILSKKLARKNRDCTKITNWPNLLFFCQEQKNTQESSQPPLKINECLSSKCNFLDSGSQKEERFWSNPLENVSLLSWENWWSSRN